MIQNYEVYLIIQPEANADKVSQTLGGLKSLLTDKVNAENLEVTEEGLKKLAYQIKKHRTGFYALITFDLDLDHSGNIQLIEKHLNLDAQVIRYLIVNQTEYYKLKSQEKESSAEITDHRSLNKGKKNKHCIVKHVGMKAVDYKDTDFLFQFVSPYAKIFGRDRTGTSAKYQRKVTKAIKRARHMALMPFTPQEQS